MLPRAVNVMPVQDEKYPETSGRIVAVLSGPSTTKPEIPIGMPREELTIVTLGAVQFVEVGLWRHRVFSPLWEAL